MKDNIICPVCGYDKLKEPPFDTFEICPSCGTEFGYNDAGYKSLLVAWKLLRKDWIRSGMRFWSKGFGDVPVSWNPREQLEKLGKQDFSFVEKFRQIFCKHKLYDIRYVHIKLKIREDLSDISLYGHPVSASFFISDEYRKCSICGLDHIVETKRLSSLATIKIGR